MNQILIQMSADELLSNYSITGTSICKLINEIDNQIKSLSRNVEVCVYSDHQNGLSVLRLGKKPSKDEGTKQSFSLPCEWNECAEASGIGSRVATMRFIVRGEISSTAEEFLNELCEITETRNADVIKNRQLSIWGNRDKTQVKWGIVAGGEKSRRLLSDIEF